MQIEIVPLLKDNYAYILAHDNECVVIDPSEEAVLGALAGRAVTQIWCTHHHMDHVGGVEAVAAAFPNAKIAGSAYDREHGRVPRQNVVAREGEDLALGSLPVRVLDVPGHTLGAVAYLVGDALFTGDTLFLAGCGRMFEGTPEVMHASLQKLATLPLNTRVFVGHEYTESNLRFGRAAEPDNAAITARAAALPKAPTVPGTIREELATNVFLRATSPAAFAALRTRKDSF